MDHHFDLVVVGSGSANTIVDKRLADWDVAIIEKGIGPFGSFGGTCLNVGCIPTKIFHAFRGRLDLRAASARTGLAQPSMFMRRCSPWS